jgi:hypothetical protein
MHARLLLPALGLAVLAACGSSTGNTGTGTSTTTGNGGSGGSGAGGSGTTTSTTSSSSSTTSTSTTSSSTTASSSSSTTGSSSSGGADCTGIDATFTAVLAKPLSGCAGFEPPCHNSGAGGLHIDPTKPTMTYNALVNVMATAMGAGVRVVPGDPAHSFLYRKLIDDLPGANDGSPMPEPGQLAGSMWMELPQDEIDTVRCWIQAGALKN